MGKAQPTQKAFIPDSVLMPLRNFGRPHDQAGLFVNSWNKSEDQLKLSFLLFEEIYLGQGNLGIIANTAKKFLFEKRHFSTSQIAEFNKITKSEFEYPPNSIVLKEKNMEVHSICSQVVKTKLIKRYGKGADDDFRVEKIVRGLRLSILDWMLMLQGEPCAYIGDDTDMEAFSYLTKQNQAKTVSTAKNILIEKHIAPLSEISWDDIFSLRNHSDLISFRRKLFEISSSLENSNSDDLVSIISEEYNKGLRERKGKIPKHLL